MRRGRAGGRQHLARATLQQGEEGALAAAVGARNGHHLPSLYRHVVYLHPSVSTRVLHPLQAQRIAAASIPGATLCCTCRDCSRLSQLTRDLRRSLVLGEGVREPPDALGLRLQRRQLCARMADFNKMMRACGHAMWRCRAAAGQLYLGR
jgi:hypothetical protein